MDKSKYSGISRKCNQKTQLKELLLNEWTNTGTEINAHLVNIMLNRFKVAIHKKGKPKNTEVIIFYL